MGLYLNKNNEEFKIDISTKPYVDKTLLISFTNSMLSTRNRFICVTRPRRFGKSMGLNMLNAYYSKGCNSLDLFKNLKIYTDQSFLTNLNKYNVIYLSIIDIFKNIDDKNIFVDKIKSLLYNDLVNIYNEVSKPLNLTDGSYLRDFINNIYNKTGDKFIFLIDEWDYPFTRAERSVCDKYMDFLAGLFKGNVPYIELAYMTGVLPIKKYSITSDLNNFKEYTMLRPGKLAPFFGFTEDEVKALCHEYDMDFNEMKSWYDGYKLDIYDIYNPMSVVSAITEGSYRDYWCETANVNLVVEYIKNKNFELKKELVELISTDTAKCNITSFNGDIRNINSRDEALTALCHLGYLGYKERNTSSGYCYIPNNEIRIELAEVLNRLNYTYLYKFISLTDDIIDALYKNDTNTINIILDDNHENFANQYDKNSEVSLKYIVIFSFFKLLESHELYQELNTFKGRADLVYIPRFKNLPAIIVELKSNKTCKSALEQIKNKEYVNCLEYYKGKILLVGINYDSDYKHSTIIEEIEK